MLIFVAGAGLYWGLRSRSQGNTNSVSKATYVGAERCAECHAEESKKWRGSHHAQAMEVATDTTVLGDFHNIRFSDMGLTVGAGERTTLV